GAADGRGYRGFRIAERQGRRRNDGVLDAILSEHPVTNLVAAGAEHGDALFGLEVLGRLGRTAHALDVFRRGTGHAAQTAYTPGDQARITEIADANRRVDAFLHQVDDPVVHAHLHRQLGILFNESRQGGHDDLAAQGDGHVDAQFSSRHTARFGDFVLGLVELAESLAAAFIKTTAQVGQTKRSRGTVEQARPQAFLQAGHRLAY